MKKNKVIIVLTLVLIAIVLFFNSRISLKEEISNDGKAENISDILKSENVSNTPLKDKIILEKISAKKDSSDQTNYIHLHYNAVMVDTHNDFIWKVYDKGAVFSRTNSFTQSDLPRFKTGGVDVQVFAIWIPLSEVKRSYSFTTSRIKDLKEIQSQNFSDFEFANNYYDIIRITNEKKLCGLIGIEGGTAIEKNLDNINTLYDMGVRCIGLTWNNSNLISTSARDKTERGRQGGLSDFGIQVIKRMNETGMLVDVSHLSDAGFWDVIENTTSPIIASHSNCYAINPHYRNLTDDQIKAIALNGGYIGINFYDKFLDSNADRDRIPNAYQKYPDELNALTEKYSDDLVKFNEERSKFFEDHNITGGISIEKVIEHIDYIKNLVGIEYVGIGSDFDGGITPPNELYDASTYPLITKRLLEKGYSAEEIRKVLGGNFLRVFKRVCG